MNKDEYLAGQTVLPVAGIDLGGTQIRAAVLQGAHIHARAATPTGRDTTPERVIARITATLQEALDQAGMSLDEIAGIGVAAPGPLDNRTGTLYAPPNLAGWQAVPLREILARQLQRPVFVEHDANTAALGEYFFGAGRGHRHLVYLTVSTGIGGGVIADGRLLEGVNGTAGELGHMTIDWRGERCSCGNIGCLEALASGTALARQANRLIASGQGADLLTFARSMLEHPAAVPDKKALPHLDLNTQPLPGTKHAFQETPDVPELTAYTVARAAEAGIPSARTLLTTAAEALGFGLVNILHIFSPEIIILGGGVMQVGSLIMEPALKIVQVHAMHANLDGARIVQAQLGENAGLIGAGILPFYYHTEHATTES